MNQREKRAYVRRALELVALNVDRNLTGVSVEDSSIGLVGHSGGPGGRSGRTSDFTAVKGIAGASDSFIEKKARDWYWLASDAYVFFRSNVDPRSSGANKTPYRVYHDTLVAEVFHRRYMCGKKLRKIAEETGIRESYVSSLLADAIEYCVILADGRGMIREDDLED